MENNECRTSNHRAQHEAKKGGHLKKLQLRLNIKCPLLLVGIAFHLYATHNQSKLIADTHTELSIFEGVSAKVSIKGHVKNVLLPFHIMQHFHHEEDKYALYYPSNAPWFDNCVQNPSIKMQIVDFLHSNMFAVF